MAAAPGRGKLQVIRSSLPYQLLLYCNGWYFAFYWLAEILMFAYKGVILPYPTGVLGPEIVLMFIFAGIEAIRLFFGQKGNLTERIMSVGLSLGFSLASVIATLYLLLWQTYVLRIELILGGVELAFIALQFLFGIISMATFARAAQY